MSELLQSLDQTISKIRLDHEASIQELKRHIFELETELALHKSLTKEALQDRDKYMRLGVKLFTQFGLVEKVFSEAKELALAYHDQTETKIEKAREEEEKAAPSSPSQIALSVASTLGNTHHD